MRVEQSSSTTLLLQRLEERSRAEIAARRDEAAETVARLERDASETRRVRREEALRDCAERVETAASLAIGEATLDSRRELLDAQHALVDEVLNRATARLASLVSEARITDAQLVKRLRDAARYVSGEASVIRCRVEMLERMHRIVSVEWPSARVEADDTATGFRVLDEAGRTTIDDTLETRLIRLRAELAIEICRVVEPEPHTGDEGR